MGEHVPRVVRDGKVAVLVSPEYGAGWSSWATSPHTPARLALCPALVEALERGCGYEEMLRIAEAEFPGQYTGGLVSLRVRWVDEGSLFRITEYDGFESLEERDACEWIVA